MAKVETWPISEDQLLSEVKGIYAGLVIVKAKCTHSQSSFAARENLPSYSVTTERVPHAANLLLGVKQKLIRQEIKTTLKRKRSCMHANDNQSLLIKTNR